MTDQATLTRAINEAIELLAEYMTDQMDAETGTYDDFPEIDTIRCQLQAAIDGEWKPL